ncbi:ubiquitin elongating factor core-domain-containing protein [Dipodascopsis tothii]|uniref:ubiquitin elongating factor core-domain-containing protein n=1 Tax=Dipodascopsis tothii TaxID=44089 RepID=UPI0034CD9FAD
MGRLTQIRNKRLARLQALQSQQRAASPSEPARAATTRPTTNGRTASPRPAPAAAVATSAPVSPAPAAAAVPEDPAKLEADFAAWEDSTLGRIFEVSVREGGEGVFLAEVAAEMAADGPVRLAQDSIDRALLARLTEVGVAAPFDYLVGSWKRVGAARRAIRYGDPLGPRKQAVLAEAKRLCCAYSVLAVTVPDMFGAEAGVDLAARLVARPDSAAGVPEEYVTDVVAWAIEDDTVADLVGPVLETLGARLRTMTMTDDYQAYFRALQALVAHKPVAALLADLPGFLPEGVTAAELELRTVLGPFFRISPVDTTVANTYFGNAKEAGSAVLASATSALSAELRTVQDNLVFVVDRVVRASPHARDRMLQYFAAAMNLNHKRRALQVDRTQVSSDAFMLNVTAVLNKLCEPFVDATFSKLDRIDAEYFVKSDRLDVREEVKLDADQSTFDGYVAARRAELAAAPAPAPNFISEVFFLNVASHHYGLGAAMQNQSQLGNDIADMDKHLRQLEAERVKWANSPQASILESTLARVRLQLSHAQALHHAFSAALNDNLAFSRSFAFLMTAATWLVRMADPAHAHPQTPVRLPIDAPCPDSFRFLPEYFVENITGFVNYYSRNMPQALWDQSMNELVVFVVTFLRTSGYIKNPYLKSKFVEVLFYGTLRQRDNRNGYLSDIVNSAPLALEHLFHVLMSFYIEIEQTGASSQFYDKFNIRYYISQIIKSVWDNPIYRTKLEQESRQDVEFFVRFVALLLNDATYLLDESLSKLAEIHKLQLELADGGAAAGTDARERAATLASAERQATSYVLLANETVALLKLFTKAVPVAFVTSEIVDRLAAMLDYNLEALVGPKCTGLKVKDPHKYHFNPKALLSTITDVYLNLRDEPPFVQAVARDGRSYRRETFSRAASIMTKYSLRSSQDIAALAAFADHVEATKAEAELGEEELGEIPDEFLDPLMYTLMEDPVILPSSRVSIDRGTIKSHLLSDATDPFNRVPLKLADVIPNTELAERITRFKAERVAESRRRKTEVAAKVEEAAAAADAAAADADVEMTL